MTRRQSPRESGDQERLDVWMSKGLKDAVQRAAAAEDTNASQLARRLLRAYLKKKGRLPPADDEA